MQLFFMHSCGAHTSFLALQDSYFYKSGGTMNFGMNLTCADNLLLKPPPIAEKKMQLVFIQSV